MSTITYGAIRPQDCDAFGRMHAEHFMGAIVSGIPQMNNGFREAVVDATDPKPARVGNAALEYRLLYFDWPRAGDLFAIRSGTLEVDAKGMNVVHWMLDPVTGAAWGSCQAYIVTFDLDARKIMPVPPAAKAALDQRQPTRHHGAVRLHRPVPRLGALDRELDVLAEARAGGPRVDGELLRDAVRRRVLAVGVEQADLLDVDLVGDQGLEAADPRAGSLAPGRRGFMPGH